MTAPFTAWHRSMDDGALRLVVAHDGRIVESVELDVSELSGPSELLSRLGPIARERLLAEAHA